MEMFLFKDFTLNKNGQMLLECFFSEPYEMNSLFFKNFSNFL